MRLNALNTSRKLLSRMRNLEGWKHLVHAISQSNTPRIQVAVSVALKAGSGFRGALEMIDKAARHVYRPQSYQEADYHRAFLIWKLGGAAAARIAHRALGLPSLDTAGRHIMTHPIRGRIMAFVPRDTSHQPDKPDWEWNGVFAPGSDLDDLDSALVECYNPTLLPALSSPLNGKQTFTARTSELRAIGALIFERAQGIQHRIRTVSSNEVFPYRLSGGTLYSTAFTQPHSTHAPYRRGMLRMQVGVRQPCASAWGRIVRPLSKSHPQRSFRTHACSAHGNSHPLRLKAQGC